MIDGRNLQGGLSSEPPHAEVKEYQPLININGMYFDKLKAENKIITFEKPIPVIFGEGMNLNNNLFRDKKITTNYNISFK
ncbi:hypothetical protein [Clostridium ihumii]|uniref:hypothetical protein n=1 Tax=Clostridium ihumii TaxID=1470356 RepID=UPI0005575E97|nr:hypothetical protein [Clostridium ihumii]